MIHGDASLEIRRCAVLKIWTAVHLVCNVGYDVRKMTRFDSRRLHHQISYC